jgi:nucleotide-binding universal stress UspA family protein
LFKNILLATDFSDHSIVARKAAVSMAQGPGKKLTVLHIYDLRQRLLDEGVLMASEVVEAAEKKRVRKEAHENMLRFCSPLTGLEINYDFQIREGRAAEEIVETATEIKADLVVIGSHSRRGFVDVSLGGVARKVGEDAPCPVLIVTNYKEPVEPEAQEKPASTPPGES